MVPKQQGIDGPQAVDGPQKVVNSPVDGPQAPDTLFTPRCTKG